MIGGLWKSTSRLALAASAAMFVGGMAMPSAQAADLGGDCCADLEERVAELEATTARKGNRKMSLTISGQVNRAVVWWDDGKLSKTFIGLDNRNSSTRLDFAGEAKVTPANKIGFEIMFDNQSGGTTSAFNQFNVDGTVNTGITSVGRQPFTGNNADDYFGGLRRAAFYLENDKVGRLTVGRYDMAGAITTIDLGGISAGASSSEELVGGSLLFRGSAGQFYNMALGAVTDPAANQPRQNGLRYDSATFMGFIATASVAEDGTDWGAMLRYANEFNGFRIAAGAGYEHYGQFVTGQACIANPAAPPTCLNGNGAGPANIDITPDVSAWGAGLSLMHVPTGLFAQGHYIHADFGQNTSATALAPVNGFWGQAKQAANPADQWLIQGGISKNWTGFGNTAIFGEYSRNTGWGSAGGPIAPNGANYGNAANATPGATAVNGVTASEVTMYGFGVTQTVDAAATELYLDARHFAADITCTGAATAAGACVGAAGTSAAHQLDSQDMWVVVGGARVKF
jgi:hypothetical protein